MGSIVAVFAHPDDETFICGGTLAKCAKEGHRTVLVCATRGEMGRRMDIPPVATRESIASMRDVELQQACEALSVGQLHLLGFRDKTLEIQPFHLLVDGILEVLMAEQPDAVITFHEQLGGHPDHCTVGAAATAAFAEYCGARPQAKLYFVAWSAMFGNPSGYGLNEDDFVQLDVSSCLPQKLAAFRAHRTQSALNQWLWGDDGEALSRLPYVEYFISADKNKGDRPCAIFRV